MSILTKKGLIIKPLAQEIITTSHKKAISLETASYTTNLSSIELLSDSEIILKNKNQLGNSLVLNITESAYKDLLNLSLFSPSVKKSFLKILNDKQKTIDLLNKFRHELIANKGDVPISLIASKEAKEVIKIAPYSDKVSLISNTDFLTQVYQVVNTYNLAITSFNVDHLGQIAINAMLNDNSEIRVGDLNTSFGIPENEVFNRGLFFSSKLNLYQMIPTMIRIICSNQLTVANTQEAMLIKTKSFHNYNKVKLDNLQKQNFVPKSFNTQVRKAFQTPASLLEFDTVVNNVLDNSQLKKPDLDHYLNYSEINEKMTYFKNKENLILTNDIKRQIPIDKTVWELLNAMTYIASNESDSLITPYQRESLKTKAGMLLAGDSKNALFDLQLKFNTPFINKWL